MVSGGGERTVEGGSGEVVVQMLVTSTIYSLIGTRKGAGASARNRK